jgi:hypothetical protein
MENENEEKLLTLNESKKLLSKADSKIYDNSKKDSNNEVEEISPIIEEHKEYSTVIDQKTVNDNMIDNLRNIYNTEKQQENPESISPNKELSLVDKGNNIITNQEIQEKNDETISEIGKLNSFSLDDEDRKQSSLNDKIDKISSGSIYNDFELKEEEIKEEL